MHAGHPPGMAIEGDHTMDQEGEEEIESQEDVPETEEEKEEKKRNALSFLESCSVSSTSKVWR